MANNSASNWLEILACCDMVTRHGKCIEEAAKLDRLVEAAREAKKILNHDNGTTHDAAERYGCAAELTAALSEIELESK